MSETDSDATKPVFAVAPVPKSKLLGMFDSSCQSADITAMLPVLGEDSNSGDNAVKVNAQSDVDVLGTANNTIAFYLSSLDVKTAYGPITVVNTGVVDSKAEDSVSLVSDSGRISVKNLAVRSGASRERKGDTRRDETRRDETCLSSELYG